MPLSPLTRLVRHARKSKRFFRLLHTDPRAALKEAAQRGIKLSAGEQKTLRALLSGKRIVIDPREYGRVSVDFWDILCKPKDYGVGPVRAAKKSRR